MLENVPLPRNDANIVNNYKMEVKFCIQSALCVSQTCLTTKFKIVISVQEISRCRSEENSMISLHGRNVLVFALKNPTVAQSFMFMLILLIYKHPFHLKNLKCFLLCFFSAPMRCELKALTRYLLFSFFPQLFLPFIQPLKESSHPCLSPSKRKITL